MQGRDHEISTWPAIIAIACGMRPFFSLLKQTYSIKETDHHIYFKSHRKVKVNPKPKNK
jgi:hypothetical protein